jgi:hypothetical protein
MVAARCAYEGYASYTDWKSLVSGDKLPNWETLPGVIQNAWHAAVMSGIKATPPMEFLKEHKNG